MHLEGKQSYIRTLVKQDLPLLVKWKNDPLIAELVSGNPIMTTLEIEERRFEKCLGEYDNLRLIIETKEGKAIGFVSICGIDKCNKKVELGMLIGEREFWAKGFGTDALNTIIDYLLNKLCFNRIGVEVFSFNERARRLYERMGFKLEGVLRQALCRRGIFEDVLLMGLIKKDYKKNKKKTPIN